MRITQGTFSFLPDLSDDQILAQVDYCLGRGWAISLERTDDPHPRNTYWEMVGLPMFDQRDAAAVMAALDEARRTLQDLRTLWGIDAPERISIDATTHLASMSDEAVEAELVQQVAMLRGLGPLVSRALALPVQTAEANDVPK